jgi:chemotaxis protein methyltransferase CheR
MSAAALDTHGIFAMDRTSFQWLCETVEGAIGVQLHAKQNLVHNRLSRRARQLGLQSLEQYRAHVEAEGEAGMQELLDILTTNVTAFFRENAHFERLGQELARFPGPRLRIWSAACSSGEEPYSIALTVQAYLRDAARRDVRVLGTDINTEVLAQAEAGIYDEDRVQGLPSEVLARGFLHGRGAKAGLVAVRPELRDLVAFRRLNLLEAWPFKGRFDFIFCRNVVIYFDKPTQARLFRRLAEQLNPGGLLFIGHSEVVVGSDDLLRPEGNTTYVRRTS